MKKVTSFKMTYRSNHFNKNQRVWMIYPTGNQAAYVFGKYRGKGRYVKAWVRWDNPGHPFPNIQEFEVDDDTAIARNCI